MANRNKPLPARVRTAQRADAALARHPGWDKWPLGRQLAYLFTPEGAADIVRRAEPHSVLLALWQLCDGARRDRSYQLLPQLLQHLAARRTTLFTRPELLPALGHIGRYYGGRVRELSGWHPRSRNPFQQLLSLVRHLFDRYGDVPAWVLHNWGSQQSGLDLAALAVYLGRGDSLRRFPYLPAPLSRRQAHLLRQAPAGCTFQQAYRYAQLAERGAADWLGVALASRLGTDAIGPDDALWLAVLDLFRADPAADPWQFGLVCDWIHFRRRVGTLAEPAQPGFSLRGRSLASLLAQAAAWHRTTGRLLPRPASQSPPERSWAGLSVPDFDAGPGYRVQVRQLLSYPALHEEGQRMRNCVAGYDRVCELGRSGIFSLSLNGANALTMQVTAARELVQVRGKYNRPASGAERRWVHHWLAATGLTLAPDAWGDPTDDN